jgi:hypothetical protein
MLFLSRLGSCGQRLRITLLLVGFPSQTSTHNRQKDVIEEEDQDVHHSTITFIHPATHFFHSSAESDSIVDASLHPGALQLGSHIASKLSHNLGDSHQASFHTHP